MDMGIIDARAGRVPGSRCSRCMGFRRNGRGRRPCRSHLGRSALKPLTVGAALAAAGAAHAVVNARVMLEPDARRASATVSVLIPARDEAGSIAACLDSITGADEVIVLDDGSTDDTAAVAAAHGATVIRGTAPPKGSLGKPHACRRLASLARGDVLVFL